MIEHDVLCEYSDEQHMVQDQLSAVLQTAHWGFRLNKSHTPSPGYDTRYAEALDCTGTEFLCPKDYQLEVWMIGDRGYPAKPPLQAWDTINNEPGNAHIEHDMPGAFVALKLVIDASRRAWFIDETGSRCVQYVDRMFVDLMPRGRDAAFMYERALESGLPTTLSAAILNS